MAHDRAVVRRSLGGANEQPVFNAPQGVNGLVGDSSLLFVFAPSTNESRVTSVRKSDRQPLETWTAYYSLSSGYSIAPIARRIYGVSTITSEFSTLELPYAADGSFGALTARGSDTGSFVDEARTYVYPTEQSVLRHNGIVYATPGLNVRASLGGALDDVDFHGSDVVVVLRGEQLYAYANTLLESGTFRLAKAARAVAVHNDSVFAFAGDDGQPQGIAVMKVALAQLTSAQPGAAIDPETTPFVADEMIRGGGDSVFMFSRSLQSIFRWSATSRSYTASLPLTGSPERIAYSPTLNRLYVGYASGKITQIKLDENATAEVPFATLPMSVRGLQAAGDFIVAVDQSGAWATHYVFGADGILKASKEWNYYSEEYVWSPANRRLYFLRDDTSPNDLHYEVIDATGQFGASADTPYHGNYAFTHPLRVSDDETAVLVGSGIEFSANGLAYAGALANAILDAVSINNRWVTLRASGDDSQVQVWTSNRLLDRSFSVPGVPLRMFDLSDGRAVVFTAIGGRTVASFINFSGSGSVTTSPAITVHPAGATSNVGKAITFTVAARGTSLNYQWLKNGSVLAGATSAQLTFNSLQLSNAGSYSVRVSNSLGSVTSRIAELTVNPAIPPPTITQSPSSIAVEKGSSVTLAVNAQGPGLSYQWKKDNVDIPFATSAILVIHGLQEIDTGSYTAHVTNESGSAASSPAIVTVIALTTQPAGRTVNVGDSASFSVEATGSTALTYQWRRNGEAIAGATTTNLSVAAVALSDMGTYDVLVKHANGTIVSDAAILAVKSTSKVVGGTEVAAGIRHPTGRVYDQVLVTESTALTTADWTANEVTRASFIDIDHDIVQVEFSGPGTLALILAGGSGPARPTRYNQAVDYVKGHAAIVITGADERTNLSVFTVGRATAFDPTGAYDILQPPSAMNDPSRNGSPLFDGHDSTVYDGIADIAYIAISSTNGRFGGIRTANTHFFASKGLAGIYAPGVAFTGPIFIGDITAFDTALPVVVTGSVSDARITGGDLLQDNGQPVEVSGIAQLKFVDGSTSHGELLPAQANQAVLEEDGVDVTEQIVVNPAP